MAGVASCLAALHVSCERRSALQLRGWQETRNLTFESDACEVSALYTSDVLNLSCHTHTWKSFSSISHKVDAYKSMYCFPAPSGGCAILVYSVSCTFLNIQVVLSVLTVTPIVPRSCIRALLVLKFEPRKQRYASISVF